MLALALRESALLDLAGNLKPEHFSVPLFGKAYGQMLQRHHQGLEVSLAVLEDLTPEEMSHLSGISQRQQGTVSEQAFKDCVAIILSQRQSAGVANDDDLVALRNKLKERKGTKA